VIKVTYLCGRVEVAPRDCASEYRCDPARSAGDRLGDRGRERLVARTRDHRAPAGGRRPL